MMRGRTNIRRVFTCVSVAVFWLAAPWGAALAADAAKKDGKVVNYDRQIANRQLEREFLNPIAASARDVTPLRAASDGTDYTGSVQYYYDQIKAKLGADYMPLDMTSDEFIRLFTGKTLDDILLASKKLEDMQKSERRDEIPYTAKEDGAALENPGYFDITVSESLLINTNVDDDNAQGLMVGLKAYPLGRWYSYLKSTGGDSDTKKTECYAVHYGKAATSVPVSEYPYAGPVWNFFRRCSVWFNWSPSTFDGGGVDGNVYGLGLGFDVTPEFALEGGYAIFDVTEKDASGTEKKDTHGAWTVGVALNLNAFNAIHKAVSSFGSK